MKLHSLRETEKSDSWVVIYEGSYGIPCWVMFTSRTWSWFQAIGASQRQRHMRGSWPSYSQKLVFLVYLLH